MGLLYTLGLRSVLQAWRHWSWNCRYPKRHVVALVITRLTKCSWRFPRQVSAQKLLTLQPESSSGFGAQLLRSRPGPSQKKKPDLRAEYHKSPPMMALGFTGKPSPNQMRKSGENSRHSVHHTAALRVKARSRAYKP